MGQQGPHRVVDKVTDSEASIPVDIPFSTEPLDHVVVIVHGVGDMMFDNPPWVRSLGRSMRTMMRLCEEAARERERETRMASPTVLLRTVEWHSTLHSEWGKLIRKATPEFPFACHNAVRGTLQDSVGDLMLFMSERWKKMLIEEVAAQVEREYHRVREARPAWSGKMSLFCHSLGAAIGYELLHQEKLRVPVEMIFCCGSPLTAYLTLQEGGISAMRSIVLSNFGPRFYNIYHPLDPSAFRLEPFLAPDRCTIPTPPAVLLPRRKNWLDEVFGFVENVVRELVQAVTPKVKQPLLASSGFPSGCSASLALSDGHRSPESFDDSFSDVTSMTSCASTQDVHTLVAEDIKSTWTEIVSGRRFDFEIDDGSRNMPPFEPLVHMGCLSAHFGYWVSMDVMRFMVDRIAEDLNKFGKHREDS